MPFKSISTVFNPGEVKILEFKIAIFNKKLWTSLSADTKKDALAYLDDCQGYLDHYKQWVSSEIENDRLNGILQRMLTAPMLGKTL